MKFYLFVLVLLFWLPTAHSQETVNVTVNDFSGLERAIVDANKRPFSVNTSILIQGDIVWQTVSDPTLSVKGHVTLFGGMFSGNANGASMTLFKIEPGGKLTVNDSQFSDIWSASNGQALFYNQGELSLENVVFESVENEGICVKFGCFFSRAPIIHNAVTGNLTLRGVRFEDSGSRSITLYLASPDVRNGILANEGHAVLIRTQIFLANEHWEQPLWNSGHLSVQNSSVLLRDNVSHFPLDLVERLEGAHTEFVNSVIEGFSGHWCDGVTSLGHNSISAPDCSWASPGDTVGISTGLVKRPRPGSFNLSPVAGGPLVDSADPGLCPDTGRGIFDGNDDGLAVCDRGAWEFRQVTLADGGANGLYFDPNQDGHYVYVLDNDYNTLVVWNTFDTAGNQAWILALGQLIGGRSMTADAYINKGGELTPLGPRNVERDRVWGSIRLELNSCEGGTFYFDSDLPEFTSGQFQIQRLAYATQIGCGD